MNFFRLERHADRLWFQPIETLPWEFDDDFDGDQAKVMPLGIILRRKRDGHLVLAGNERCGFRTAGCTCCARAWSDVIDDYGEWAWAF